MGLCEGGVAVQWLAAYREGNRAGCYDFDLDWGLCLRAPSALGSRAGSSDVTE